MNTGLGFPKDTNNFKEDLWVKQGLSAQLVYYSSLLVTFFMSND